MNTDSSPNILTSSAVRGGLIAVLALLSLFLLAQTLHAFSNISRSGLPATDTITVQGTGQVTLPPDVARVSFTVQNTASTVAIAQEETTEQTNAALDFLEQAGIEDKDVRTLSYSISPQYSYPNPCPPTMSYCPSYTGEPKITGYIVSQTVEVTVRELAEVGDLIAGLGDLEVQNLYGPSFGLDDSTAGYDAARDEAIEKAKEQAEVLAEQLGVRLGKIISFGESSGGYPYPAYGYGMGGAKDARVEMQAANPTLPTGENTYSASVSITYEIK